MRVRVSKMLVCSTSVVALFATAQAQAQADAGTPPAEPAAATAPADAMPGADDSDIIVTGIRASQRASLEAKRQSSVILDAVTATDVGKFPDANIADSLQRITGVAIERTGGEGQYITVRGFGPQYNNVLVNGRTLATTSIGREFDFATLSSALISRAEVFKSYDPKLQEGGIGATVNIVTARPLEGATGFHVTAQAGSIYDLLSKKATPNLGFVAAYHSPDGRFGVEASLNYTRRKSFDDQAKVEGWFAVAPDSKTVSLINGTPQSTGLTPAAYSFLNDGGTRTLYVPQAYDNWRATFDQKRITTNLTAQYRPTDTLTVTLDGLYSKYDTYTRNTYYKSFFVQPYFADIGFDANGTVTNFTRPGRAFFAANPLLAADPRSVPQQSDNIVNIQDRDTDTYQFGGNVKWEAGEAVTLEADLSNSRAKLRAYVPGLVIGNYLQNPVTFSLPAGQTLPSLTRSETVTPSQLTNHYTGINDSRYTDDLTEARVQGEWKVDAGIFSAVQFGGFFSRREKQDTEYFTPGSNYCAYCGYSTPVDTTPIKPYKLTNFLPNSSGSKGIIADFYQFSVADIIAYQSRPATLNARTAGEQAALPTATFLARGGFTPVLQPQQGFDVTEKVFAGFLNTSWKGSIWSANIGARLAYTRTSSTGVIQPVTGIAPNPGDSSLLLFSYGPETPVTIRNSYFNILPAANLKIEAARDVVLRLAASKTLTRPTLSDLGPNNSYAGRVTQPLSSGGNPLLDPFTAWNFDASAEWYVARDAALTAAAFHKKFSGFLSNQTVIVPRQGTDLSGQAYTYNFLDSRPRNGNSGSVTGFELGANYAIGAGILSGLGAGANYTRVTSTQKVVTPGDCADIEGLSKNSYNLSGFYERHGIQARVAYNWRSAYLRVCRGAQGKPENTDAYGQVDFNLAYDVDRNFQIYLEGVNITNSYNYQYSVYPNRILLNQSTGRRLLAGVRAKF
ncbi:TonB-dependent receptor [Sphingomonas metalli]|uniref:TonB-dependent receptor n=1 Tax=Sphingomonas metalli TaxID=1779358 RepID=A0A916SYA8_9SPHN|nr:TonB-dependent receptor [Sphingomonas metalli]GGB22924.1 TonB-dependent receptor [Sphingomonas metalli]